MKRITFLVALLFFVFVFSDRGHSMVQPSDTILIHNNNYGEGGGEEGEDLNGIGIVPIRCELSDAESELTFFFLDDLGFVSVTIYNLTTFEVVSRVLDSQLGIEYFAFSGTHGHYRIIITTTLGQSYYGHFMIE